MKKNRMTTPRRASMYGGLLLFSVLGLISLLPLRAAASATWDGGGSDGSWGTAANWVGDTVPTFDDTLEVILTGTLQPATYLSADRTIKSLTFDANADTAFTIRLADAASGGTAKNLTFGATSPAITIDAGASAAHTLGVTLGSVVLLANLPITHNGPANFTIGRPITGAFGLTKSGTGMLTLSGVNTFSGGMTLSTGTLNINNASALGAAAGTFTIAGGTLNNTFTSDLVLGNNNPQAWNGDFTFTGTKNLNMGSGSVTPNASRVVTVTAGTLAVGGAIGGGAISLTKAGAGTLTLYGANTFSGGATISAGKLVGVSGGACASAVSVAAGTTLGVQVLSSGGQWTCNGLTLDSGSTTAEFKLYTAGSSATFAPLQVNGNLVNNGTLNVTILGGGFTIGTYPLIKYTGSLTVGMLGTVTMPNGGAATLVNNTGNNSIDLNVTTGNQLTWGSTGTETWNISGVQNWNNSANQYVQASIPGNAVMFDDTPNGDGPFTVTVVASGVSPAFVTVNNSKKYTIAGGPLTVSTGLTKSGAGTLTLSGANSFFGALSVKAGTLAIATINNASANGPLGNSALAVALGDPGGAIGTLEYTGASASSTKKFSMATGGSGVFQVDTLGTTLSLAGVIDGSGSLTKSGAGILALSGVNTFTGKTTVNAGTLSIAAETGLGGNPGALTADQLTLNGGTVKATEDFTLNQNRGVTLGAAGGTLDVSTSKTLSIPAILAGSGNLTKTSAGTLTLSGANTFSGKVGIHGGALRAASLNNVAGGSASSSLGAPITAANGTIALGAAAVAGMLTYTGNGETTDRVIDLAGTTGGATIYQSGSGLLKFTSAFTATGNGSKTLTLQSSSAGTGEVAGAIVNYSDSGITSLSKTGSSGAWLLSGVNTYSGATTISGGTLLLGHASALGTTAGGTTVGSGGTLDLNGMAVGDEAVSLSGVGVSGIGALANKNGAASLSGAITLADAATIGATQNCTLALSGIISGTAALIKKGQGIITLSGNNGATLTGAGSTITIGGGTLKVGHASALGDTLAGTTVESSYTLDLNGFAVGAEPLTLSGNGGSTGGGGGSLVNGSATAASVSGPVTLTGNIIIKTTSGDLTLSGVIDDGASTFNVLPTSGGSHTLTLSGANTYDGATTNSGGMLKLGNASALGSTLRGTTVSSGALDMNGQAVGAEALTINGMGISGGGALVNSSATAASLAGAITLGSASTITAAGAGGLALSGGINNNTYLVTFDGANATAVTTTKITGTGGLTKNGAGTLTLGVANDYTGATTVNGGTLGGAGCSSSAATVNSGATIAPGNGGIGTFNSGALTFNAGSALDWEFDASTADLVAAGTLTFATSPGDVTIKVKSENAVFSGEVRTLFTFTGTAPGIGGLAFNVDEAPHVQSASARITDNKVEVVLIPEPGLLALTGLLLIGLRAGAEF